MGADSQVRGDVVLGRSEIESELDFRIAGSSLPVSFERARGGCGGMVAGESVSRSIERFAEIFRREIAQTKNNDRTLDCRWLWPWCFDAGLVRGRSGGNDGGLKVLFNCWRQVLPGREPLIDFGIASNAAPENPAL